MKKQIIKIAGFEYAFEPSEKLIGIVLRDKKGWSMIVSNTPNSRQLSKKLDSIPSSFKTSGVTSLPQRIIKTK